MLILTRVFTGFAAAALGLALLAQSASTAPDVIFVCEHGAAKSVIAAAHFNQIAQERGLKLRAAARGTNPDPEVSPKVVSGLKSEGIKEITEKPQLVNEQDTRNAKRVVTLGCKLPHKARSTDWNAIPSPGESYSAASSTIKGLVEGLLDDLAGAGSTRGKRAR